MDLTAVAMHSKGCLKRSDLDNYLSKATKDFQLIVPALFKSGFCLAIATHSDEAEYSCFVSREKHILGDELASALLHHCFPKVIGDSFFIVAYNPSVRHSEECDKIKRYHMRRLREHFQVDAKEIIFFDDTPSVVKDCNEVCGVRTVQVDPHHGFRLEDLLNAF